MTAGARNHRYGLNPPGRVAFWGGCAALMLLPVVLLRALDDRPSDPKDYIFLFILLLGAGLAWEAAAKVSDRLAHRAGIAVALAAALLSTWINLAVGIIGSEDNPANWIYAAVVAVAGAGALLARFRPAGMARAMTVAAAAQILTLVAAAIAGLGFTGPITIFFTALWLISARLFRRAARAGS